MTTRTMDLTSSQESEQVLKDSIPFFLEKDAVRKPDEIEPLLPSSTSTSTTSDETFVHYLDTYRRPSGNKQ